MVCVSEVIHGWLGWCPNTPAMHKAHPVLVAPVGIVLENPEGGSGGPGGMGRGIRFAVASLNVLNRNRCLLWFSLLTGLVAGGVFFSQYCVGLLGTYPYDAIDFRRWLVLTFGIGLFATFCCNVLIAGLLMSLSPKNGEPVSFREGLSRAKLHLRRLADWSVILALWTTALFAVLPYLGFSRFFLYPVAHLFPFRFILLPEVYHIGPMGGTYAMLYALTSSMAMAAIVLFLTVITLFVVPLLVLENKSLPEAVGGSFGFMKETLAEILTAFLMIGAILFAVSLLSLLFGTVYGIVAPDMQLFWYPGDEWIAAAVLFILLLSALAFIGSTVAGIVTFSLYRYAKTGKVPGTTEDARKASPP